MNIDLAHDPILNRKQLRLFLSYAPILGGLKTRFAAPQSARGQDSYYPRLTIYNFNYFSRLDLIGAPSPSAPYATGAALKAWEPSECSIHDEDLPEHPIKS